MNDPKHITSGLRLTSGVRFTSGVLVSGKGLASGQAACEFMGDEIDTQAPAAFRLAPRTYNLAVAEETRQRTVRSEVLASLPLQLEFREASADECARQRWTSAANCWNWELTVEHDNGSLAVALTA